MSPVQVERHDGAGATESTATQLSPELVELLRTVLVAVARDQKGEGQAAEPKKAEKEKKPEEQVPLFWKLCSAALLSVTALIMVTLYNQLNNTASNLRGDVGQLRNELGQLRTDLVPKDDYNERIGKIVQGIKDVQANNKSTAETVRLRVDEQRAMVAELRQQIKDMERDLVLLREQLTALEQKSGTKPLPRDTRKTP